MFMRYRGGGIGHATNQVQLSEEDDAMDIDDIDEDNADKVNGGRDLEPSDEPSDKHLVEELLQIASSMAAGPWEEVECAVVIDPGEEDVSEEESDGAMAVMGNGEEYLGPEDGEDEDYIDTGYGAL